MKQRTIYCLVTLAALTLSPLAHSSHDLRAAVTREGVQGQTVKSSDAPPSGVGLTKVGPGTLRLNYVVKRDDGETKFELIAERGAVKKVTATDASGTRTLKPVKAGVRLAAQAQPCGADGQGEKSLTLEDGQVVKVKACNAILIGLLLPAVQKIREPAARSKLADNSRVAVAGATCTEDKPCCFEDEKLGMTVCWHP
ncbi:MAG: hypothetical protein QOD32_3056 [Pyrinomonadaceae bacterium]|jgi:hypothetical protein|nr:hypothetical protein [Pyrinomonadaceae bacterium]